MPIRGAVARRRIPRRFFAAVLLMATAFGAYQLMPSQLWKDRAVEPVAAIALPQEPEIRTKPMLLDPDVVYDVQDGDNLAGVFEGHDVAYPEIVQLEQASKNVFDLTRIQAGKQVAYTFAPEGSSYRLSAVVYQPDANRVIRAVQNEAGWIVTEELIVYEIRENTAAGTVDTSLYVSGLAKGVDEKVILQLADIFAWDVDFARDTKNGDTYRALYEEKWLDGQFVTSGKILAAEYVNKGQTFRAYYFKQDNGEWGYYDAQGKALHKAFLKAPVNFRYVSSGFSTARFHPILNKVIPHDGVDYAADYGVPIIAIGDGVISKMGWNGGYGNRIEIRHNELYGSQYSHMSGYVKHMRVGDRVKQGDTVGYVGSTGYSTGNHVHFSMTEYGTYVDPSSVDAPDGEALDDTFMGSFGRAAENWSKRLDELTVEP